MNNIIHSGTYIPKKKALGEISFNVHATLFYYVLPIKQRIISPNHLGFHLFQYILIGIIMTAWLDLPNGMTIDYWRETTWIVN